MRPDDMVVCLLCYELLPRGKLYNLGGCALEDLVCRMPGRERLIPCKFVVDPVLLDALFCLPLAGAPSVFCTSAGVLGSALTTVTFQ